MKNIIKRTLAITLAFAVAFTFFPALSGGLDAHAASKPAKVTKLNLAWKGQTSTLTWSKVKKNLNGYTVFRNGTAIASVGKGTLTFKDSNLETGTTYSYYVKAFKNTKQKQWFNKKTGKWQKKKPAKKYRGKSKKVKVKVYGKASPTLKCITSGSKPSGNEGAYSINVKCDKVEQTSLSLSWSSVQGATSYEVWRNGGYVTTTTSLSFKDENLTKDTEYVYVIKAKKGSDTLVENNGLRVFTSFNTNLDIQRVNSGIKLTWNPDGIVTRFEIYKGDLVNEGEKNTIKNEIKIGDTTELSFVDETAGPDDYPCYMIKMYRGDTLRISPLKWISEPKSTGN